MTREVEFGGGVVVVPAWMVRDTDRKVDAHRTDVFIVYPDDTTGEQLDEIIKATAELQRKPIE